MRWEFRLALTLILVTILLPYNPIPAGHGGKIAIQGSHPQLFGDTRADNTDIYVPIWKNGNRWEYSFTAQGSMSGISSMTAQGTIVYQVSGEETITVAGQSIDCYKVSYTRQFSSQGYTRSTVTMNGATQGTEWYAKDTLELVKAQYHTEAGGQGQDGGFSVGIGITDDSTVEETTIGDFWAFPIAEQEDWTSQSVKSGTSDTYVDYTPDGGFYPDDEHTTTSTTTTESFTISSQGRESKQCSAGTFDSIKVVASDQWSRTDGQSGTGTYTKWISHLVGNAVYITMSNVYDMGMKISTATMDLVAYTYTYQPPPEYGVSANADDNNKEAKDGETVDYVITVVNSGGYDDTITCEVLDGGTGWGTLDKTSLDLPVWGSGQVTYTVNIPEGTEPGDYADQIKFTSTGDNTKYVILTLTTTVLANMPPKVTGRTPSQDTLEVIVNDTVSFSVIASDPEGEALTYEWYVNGTPAGSNGNSLEYIANRTGNITVEVHISDGELYTNVSWTLRVLGEGANRAPIVSWSSPASPDVSAYDVETVEFGLALYDPDGDMVSLDYYLDDQDYPFRSVPPATTINDTFELKMKTLGIGKHTLKAVFYDERHSADLKWHITVKDSGSVVFPVYNITPEDGGIYQKGDKLTFSFETNYTYDYRADWFLDWSPATPLVETSLTVDTSKLSLGDHIVAVSIYPSLGSYRSLMWNFTLVDDLYPKLNPSPTTDVVNTNLMEEVRLSLKEAPKDWIFRWYINGEEDITQKSAVFKHTFERAGDFNVTVVVTNAYGMNGSHTWTVVVSSNRNMPPEITSYSPLRDVRIKEGQTATFRVTVTDDDDIDDTVYVKWYRNDVEVGSGTEYIFSTSPGSEGKYTVKAVASDGKFTTSHQWTVQVSAAPVTVEDDSRSQGLKYLAWGSGILAFVVLIGVVSYAFKPPSRKKKKHVSLHCPKCMAYVEEDWKFCPMCDTRLDLTCTGCGIKIIPDWKICPNCNKRLTPEERGIEQERGVIEPPTPPVAEKEKPKSQKERRRNTTHRPAAAPGRRWRRVPVDHSKEDEELEGIEW